MFSTFISICPWTLMNPNEADNIIPIYSFKNKGSGIPVMAQQKQTWLVSMRTWGRGFDPWPSSLGWGSGIAWSYGVGHRHSLDLALLWLWCRLVATALIQPLAWEPPYALSVPLKKKKKMKDQRGKLLIMVKTAHCGPVSLLFCLRKRTPIFELGKLLPGIKATFPSAPPNPIRYVGA